MIKLVRLVAALALCFAVVSSTTGPARAQVIPVPVPYSPKAGVIFNDPTGTRDQQYAILDHLNKSIDSSPPGSTIRIATYSLSMVETADALIAAHNRGVNVKMVIDSHALTDSMARVKAALGTNTSKGSFYKACKFSCMSDKPSFQHAKLYMFSTAGTSRWVTMIASGNPAYTAATGSWNNNYTMVNDTVFYKSNVKFFNDLVPDKTQTNYYRTTTSAKFKEYYLPRAKGDTMYNALSDVTCSGAALGYGAKGKTTVRVAMYRWTSLRANIASKLWALDNAGCDVEVIYTGHVVEAKVVRALLKKGGKHGGIPVYDGGLDRSRGDKRDLYVHHKYVVIDGVYRGNPRSKIVFTGSANFTDNTLRRNDDIIFKISDAAVTTAFQQNFRYIRDKWTKRVRTVPSAAAVRADARRSSGETPYDYNEGE